MPDGNDESSSDAEYRKSDRDRGLSSADHPLEIAEFLSDGMQRRTIRSVVLSRPQNREEPHRRVDIRPVKLHGGWHYQFSAATDTQHFHSNLAPEAAARECLRLIAEVYRDLRVVTDTEIREARKSKGGKWFLRRLPNTSGRKLKTTESVSPAEVSTATKRDPGSRAAGSAGTLKILADRFAGTADGDTVNDSGMDPCVIDCEMSHNRQRQYLIPEGIPCPFLIRTGIMLPDGRVRSKHYHKFRQINRFLEFVLDCLPAFESVQVVRIVDFGCGKSYLTFATHYLLTHVLQRQCRIVGLDQRTDVIDSCQRISEELGLQNLEFRVGEIAGYRSDGPVDLVISLHACNTATDDAIAQAVSWNTRVILAVPCCQHELASRMNHQSMPILTRHGVLKDRFAALATDAIRAAVLETVGYDATVMEFIETEYTPKNLLIRAIRRDGPRNPELQQKYHSQLEEFHRQIGVASLRIEQYFGKSSDPSVPISGHSDVLPVNPVPSES
ncbi:MAG: class I SAM-dependent methyltransferase [Planctomyces sp.]